MPWKLCCGFELWKTTKGTTKKNTKNKVAIAKDEELNCDESKAMSDQRDVQDIFTNQVMLYLAGYIGHEWELLGFNLGLSRDEVAQAAAANRNDNKNKVHQMLMTWLKNNQSNHRRYETCVRALETSGRKDLAQVRRKYIVQSGQNKNSRKLKCQRHFPCLLELIRFDQRSRE
uniref:p53-induced death domain-containing protein 1-like isoform X2 n=1 Tax=Styela clava TaxID=7725 RepID=UPI001939BE37|nr:p53-induced death domain-containing protein 1-like isoform X2 [Styela clava]